MKRPFLITLGTLIILITASLILASLKSVQKYRFGTSAEELHKMLVENDHFITPSEADEILKRGDESYIFVDLRNPRSYDNYHIDGAVNVPMQRVLDEEYEDALKDNRKKILYSDEGITSNEVWMVLSQYGYENLYVLEGGLEYWRRNMVDKDIFKAVDDFSDEKAKYDYLKVISGEDK
jgi:rhodanese-related sulfurtransferase